MSGLVEELRRRLNSLLGKTLPSGLKLAGWRFDLHEVTQLELGLKNNKIGGPYTAPSLKCDTGGELCLIWEEQKYTFTRIERRVLEEFQANLELWEKMAYKDPFGPGLVKPYEPPAVLLAEEEVSRILEGDFAPVFFFPVRGMEILSAYGVKKVDGRVKVSHDRRLVANSENLWITYEQTPVELFMDGDDLFGDSFAEKRLPTQEEFEALVHYTGQTVRELKKKTNLPREGEM